MELNKESAIQSLRDREEFFFANAAATNMPFIVCDEETYNDQVWLFSTEDEVKAYFEKQKEKKIPLLGKKCEKRAFAGFFQQLRMIGVNTVVWTMGEECSEIELDVIAPEPELTEEQKKKVPPMNPSLQLSGIYFMQEMRRPLSMEEHVENGIRDLEEEMLANICRSTYFVLLRQDPKDEKKVGAVLMQSKDKKQMFQPLFTDAMEMAKFSGKNNEGIRILRVPFVKLKELMHPNAAGVVVNPAGFNLTLSKEQVLKLIG